MRCRISDLRQLEIIDLSTGNRLGCADDFCVDTDTGKLIGVVRYGRERLWGLLGRAPDTEYPYACVQRVGTQTILLQPDLALPENDLLAPYRRPRM